MTNLDKAKAGVARWEDELAGTDVPDSIYDIGKEVMSALTAHEKDLEELVKLSAHALSVLRVNKYDIAADHLQEVLNRFEVKK